jgi:cell shape-determining protein MreC
MAAQSKTTAVHFSLIFFVMLSVILGVVAYLFYADYREQQAAFAKNQSDLNAAEAANRRYMEEIDALKKTIGLEMPEVGVAAPGDNTVLSQAQSAIQTLGTNSSAPSFMAALRDLRNEYNNRTLQLAELQARLDQLQRDYERLRDEHYVSVAQVHDERRQAAEQDLQGQQTQFAESIAAKDREIAQLRDQTVSLQTELEQTRQQFNAQLARLQEDRDRLAQRNIMLNDQLDQIKGESFEVADGEIVRVDQVNRLVWINLGSAHNLRPRTNFSVYAKGHRGIAAPGRVRAVDGRPEDIKAAIEVTRILEDRLAEARILSDDPSRPIAKGDPIYTPLWNPGRTERFAFVGLIDIDSDGSYTGDRERLHDLIRSAGAEISSEVNDLGERTPQNAQGEPVRIDEQTRFLVIGAIPDWSTEPPGERRQQLQQIAEHRKQMEDEARSAGVRVVNLNTFLDYIGYVPQQRRWSPGETSGWNLQAGAREAATDRSPTARQSSTGQTSGLFDTSRRRPNPAGATIQRFNGNGR